MSTESLVTQIIEAQASAAPTVQPAPGPQTQSAILDQIVGEGETRQRWLDEVLSEPDPAAAIRKWLAGMPVTAAPRSPQALARLLGCHIAMIDAIITRQLNAILHHPRLQQLEASWRGLRYLVDQADPEENVKIRVLNASWRDLAKDLDGAVEFDQSQIFRKVYSEEFGMAGGEPFGVLIGDYFVGRRLGADHKIDDVSVLRGLSQVAAAAFAPFISAAHPELLGLSEFSQLERPSDLSRIFEHPDYLKWRAFRDTDDARFMGLVLPRVLARTPHADDGSRADCFRFQEDVSSPDRSGYLWGNAAYAFAAVLVRTFQECGWMAEIRGFQRDNLGGGLVTGLPVHWLATDRSGVVSKFSTEIAISDTREKELGDIGLISLCHCKDTELCVFYGNQSVQKPKTYDKAVATTNAKMSAMLQYILCVSRFSHYLKVLARDKIGALTEPNQLEDHLRNWLTGYVANDLNASPSVRAKYPLREVEVQVRETPGRPGSYQCVMHLLPHTQLDAMTVGIKLSTELTGAKQT